MCHRTSLQWPSWPPLLYPHVRNVVYSLELNAYRDQFTQFELTTDNPRKDTLDYVILICSKTEWMRKAIQLNPFHTEHFVWVDFGIHHLFGNNPLSIQSLHYEGDQVRIGRIWDPTYVRNPEDIYHKVAWYFAGGVFGGKRKALLDFDIQMKKMHWNHSREKGSYVGSECMETYLSGESSVVFFVWMQS